MARKALVTGITGQDGSYLAELLLAKGYEVHGVVRRSSSMNRSRIDHLQHTNPGQDESSRFVLHYGDMTDSGGLNRLVKNIRPDEIYNLAAQSHVQISFDQPEYTGDADALGTTRILEAIRTAGRQYVSNRVRCAVVISLRETTSVKFATSNLNVGPLNFGSNQNALKFG